LVFAAWETPGSGAQRRRTGEGLPCCKGLKKTRGESMLEEGVPLCDRLPVIHGFTEYLRFKAGISGTYALIAIKASVFYPVVG